MTDASLRFLRFPRANSVAALLSACAFATVASAQRNAAPPKLPPWDDTTNESPTYPVGDAVPVYRAVLDLIYLDGGKRPPVIIMLDSAEGGHIGGPCPFAKCIGNKWTHKSRMDPTTVRAYAELTRKRPAVAPFGYSIPIVFISYDDVRRMDADGRELIAAHPTAPGFTARQWGFWAELQRKYPQAWGVTIMSKVGFNKRHTEALVQAHQWCGDDCRVHETLFLRQSHGRWRVVERIPEEVDVGYSPYVRYLGPGGTIPKESEIIPVAGQSVPTEATARADVYRMVLDSLYHVNGERPKRIVLTNWFPATGSMAKHTSSLDSAVIKKFFLLGGLRAPLDAISRYRIPVSALPVDSIAALRARGNALDVEQTGYPLWVAFTKKYPGAWGMLGLSRIAFSGNRSRALVSTYHACGESCASRDIWFLTRSGKTWRIAERIPVDTQNNVELEPLRYVGSDVTPNAYRAPRVRGIVTDAETGAPIPSLTIRVRRMLNSGLNVDDPTLRTDSLGRFTLARLPLRSALNIIVECPNGSRDGTVFIPLYIAAGLDTTIHTSLSPAACNYASLHPVKPPAP